jgi:hypothetical protein
MQFLTPKLVLPFLLALSGRIVYISNVINSVIYKSYRVRSILRSGFLTALFVLLSFPLSATDHESHIREDFTDLGNWKPLVFPKIPRYTLYSIESKGKLNYLRAESSASSSGLVYTREFDVYRYPNIRWRWKVDNVYRGESVNQEGRKQGDDYPIRIYVIFKYDPEHADPLEKITFTAAKRRHGEFPPHSALNYVWASNINSKTTMPNPYSSRSRMIFLQMGDENKGRWIEESINILADYQRAFGESPPATASLAIMNDSDDTGQSSVSYVEFIEIYP